MPIILAAAAALAVQDTIYSLLPPSGFSVNKLCYQCPNSSYADFVLENDPLIPDHTKAQGECKGFGYKYSLGPDPIFTAADLWAGSRQAAAGGPRTSVGTTASDWNTTCAGPRQSPLRCVPRTLTYMYYGHGTNRGIVWVCVCACVFLCVSCSFKVPTHTRASLHMCIRDLAPVHMRSKAMSTHAI